MEKNKILKKMIEDLENVTQEEIEKEKEYKVLKESEPIEFLEALVDSEEEKEQVKLYGKDSINK